MPLLESIGYALVGGILPPLVWLYFMNKEDSRCPEPRWLVGLAFITGMIAVPIVLPLESYAIQKLGEGTLGTIISWATIEETVKYALAAIVILWRKQVNESLDLVIYMLTVALGFAALENTLFLIQPFSQGQFLAGIATDNLRFIGSTLLHAIASAAIGFALAFSYTWSPRARAISASIGLILAITLHALFNFFIINASGSATLLSFFVVWTGTVVFLAVFEILKFIQYQNSPRNVC